MPIMYDYVQGKGGSLPFYKRSKKTARQSIKTSLYRPRSFRAPQSFIRSVSGGLSIQNTASNRGFQVGAGFTQGVAMKFALDGFTVVSPGGTTNTYAMSYSDFQNMYDQYRIKKIVVRFYLSWDNTDNSTGAKGVNPIFTIAQDNVDNVAPSTETELRQYNTQKDFQLSGNRYTTKVYPKIVSEVLGSTGTAAAVGSAANQWIQTANPSIPHYGLKLWMNLLDFYSNTTALGNMLVTCDYHLEMKNTI